MLDYVLCERLGSSALLCSVCLCRYPPLARSVYYTHVFVFVFVIVHKQVTTIGRFVFASKHTHPVRVTPPALVHVLMNTLASCRWLQCRPSTRIYIIRPICNYHPHTHNTAVSAALLIECTCVCVCVHVRPAQKTHPLKHIPTLHERPPSLTRILRSILILCARCVFARNPAGWNGVGGVRAYVRVYYLQSLCRCRLKCIFLYCIF